MHKFHRINKNDITIVVSSKKVKIPYGVCKTNKNNTFKEIIEKPELNYNVNTGFYLINSDIKEVFKEKTLQEKISSGRLDFGLDLIPHLVNTNRDVYGYLMPGKWFDFGTPSNYLNSSLSLLATDIDRMGINGHVPGSKNLYPKS